MGSEYFEVRSKGKNAKSAFDAARYDAFYEHGHGGYTGTIAEKGSFNLYELQPGETPEAAVARLEVELDKYGPAGCLKVGEGEYLFFGWAAS